jgi:hypothetical protein
MKSSKLSPEIMTPASSAKVMGSDKEFILRARLKVKFSLERAMKAQRGSRGTVLLFL